MAARKEQNAQGRAQLTQVALPLSAPMERLPPGDPDECGETLHHGSLPD